MKKRLAVLLIAAITVLAVPLTASAATVIVQNYFYAHANTPGTFPFKDKYGTGVQYGDNVQHDAEIVSFYVEAQGMASGDKITAYSSGGGSWNVTPGQLMTVNIPASQSLRIDLIKNGTNEVFAKMTDLYAYDQSDGGVNVGYVFSVNDIPTSYGDLGPGSGGGSVVTVNGNYYYFPERDLYKYDYDKPSGVSRYELHFLANDGSTLYKRDYEQAPTGIHYLTCNGTYQMRFFDGSGQLVAQSPTMQTTAITAPTCNSFSGNGAGFNDFTVQAKPDGMPGYTNFTWDPVPGATRYEVYRDGQRFGEDMGQSTLPLSVVTPLPGHYSFIAYNGNEIIGQSDVTVNPTDPTDPEDPGDGETGCDGCQLLSDMLDCPRWNEYMGDLTGAIKDALPPPPNWDEIADKIGKATIDHLSDYLGDVPAVPSKEQIKNDTNQPLPPVDISVPEVDELVPTVPSDFNTPKPFDISSGPQIEIKDESKPFNITDPLSGMQIDDPGTPVIPGDPRNSSGGIKSPDQVDTGGAATPTAPPSEAPPVPAGGDPEEVPPNPMPTPGDSGGAGAIPSIPDSIIPIPGGT